ncbi:MAG: heme exporter protein CcmD [Halioglobus sp.]|nr:heme exporter protein CcmD [Halioglobus sp.]|tara:strand:+ start:1284 stop:1484 length:201 start_codon:yes stop_codon:yes gene_type:complete
MYFDSVEAMLAMEGHGVFVWSAYVVTAVVIALILLLPLRRQRRLLRELAADERRARAVAANARGSS